MATKNTPPTDDFDMDAALQPLADETAKKYARWHKADSQVSALEDQIKARQDEIAEEMRGKYPELYAELELAEADLQETEQRYTETAREMWEEIRPKRKMFCDKTVRITENVEVNLVSPEGVIVRWLQEHGYEGLTMRVLDKKKFRDAMKSEVIQPSNDIATKETVVKSNIQRPALLKLSGAENE